MGTNELKKIKYQKITYHHSVFLIHFRSLIPFTLQKQLPWGILQKSFSEKVCKFHRKAPEMERFLVNIKAILELFYCYCFKIDQSMAMSCKNQHIYKGLSFYPGSIQNFVRTMFLRTGSEYASAIYNLKWKSCNSLGNSFLIVCLCGSIHSVDTWQATSFQF